MSNSLSLANKYRPHTFSSMVGQKPVVAALKGKIAEGNIPQVMLFWGVHGTGKTTVARILAKIINCDNPNEDGPCCTCETCLSIDRDNNCDVLELDAASRNKVEDVAQIIESAKYLPMGNKKVIIMDEVHMLSNAAFNKLLKIVEEPPKHCVFIFCTTERQKIPATILSRCNQFEFRKVSDEDILDNLKRICEQEQISYEEDALCMITKAGGGSVRDSLSILEQLSFGDTLTVNLVASALGLATDESIFSILLAIGERNPQMAVCHLSDVLDSGKNVVSFLRSLVDVLMDVINIHSGLSLRSMAVTKDYKDGIEHLLPIITSNMATDYIRVLVDALASGKSYGLEFATQIAVLKMIEQSNREDQLLKRISNLEERLDTVLTSGVAITATTSSVSVTEPKESVATNVAVEPSDAVSVSEEEKEDIPVTPGFERVDMMDTPFDDFDDAAVPTPVDAVPVVAQPVSVEEKEEAVEETPQPDTSVDLPFDIPGGMIVSSETTEQPVETQNETKKPTTSKAEESELVAFDDFDDFDGSSFGGFSFSSLARQS